MDLTGQERHLLSLRGNTMNRVTILLNDEIREWLKREAERCGCKSMSTHVRHMLTEAWVKQGS